MASLFNKWVPFVCPNNFLMSMKIMGLHETLNSHTAHVSTVFSKKKKEFPCRLSDVDPCATLPACTFLFRVVCEREIYFGLTCFTNKNAVLNANEIHIFSSISDFYWLDWILGAWFSTPFVAIFALLALICYVCRDRNSYFVAFFSFSSPGDVIGPVGTKNNTKLEHHIRLHTIQNAHNCLLFNWYQSSHLPLICRYLFICQIFWNNEKLSVWIRCVDFDNKLLVKVVCNFFFVIFWSEFRRATVVHKSN